jgi:hypothetical protein
MSGSVCAAESVSVWYSSTCETPLCSGRYSVSDQQSRLRKLGDRCSHNGILPHERLLPSSAHRTHTRSHTHTHTHTYTHVQYPHKHTYTPRHTPKHTPRHTPRHTPTHTETYTETHARTHSHVTDTHSYRTHSHTLAHTHTHVHTHTHIRTHTHTRTPKHTRASELLKKVGFFLFRIVCPCLFRKNHGQNLLELISATVQITFILELGKLFRSRKRMTQVLIPLISVQNV